MRHTATCLVCLPPADIHADIGLHRWLGSCLNSFGSGMVHLPPLQQLEGMGCRRRGCLYLAAPTYPCTRAHLNPRALRFGDASRYFAGMALAPRTCACAAITTFRAGTLPNARHYPHLHFFTATRHHNTLAPCCTRCHTLPHTATFPLLALLALCGSVWPLLP